jgi:hypothetical protein
LLLKFTGKSAGCPAFLPVGRNAGRAVTDSRSGVKADPLIISTFPGSSTLCLPAVGRGGELHSTGYLIKGVLQGGSYKWNQDETFNIDSFIFQLDQTHVQMSYLTGPLAVMNYEEATGVVLR